MGAWSHESFRNDDACGWAAQLDEYDDLSLVEAKARRALDRVLAGPSELMELWDESGESEAWQTAVRELKGRIRV